MSNGYSINNTSFFESSALSTTAAPGLSESGAPGFSAKPVQAAGGGAVVINLNTSVDEIDPANDVGAVFLGNGPHTHFGHGIYFDEEQYLWTSVNGLGVDPQLSGTGHEVALSGTAPFTATAWATAAQTVISGEGYSVSRSGPELTVTVATEARAVTAASAQNGLTTFRGRGDGRIIGSQDLTAGSSAAINGQSFIQVLPGDVPSGAFRVIAFGVTRGSNVTNGVRMELFSGGANFDPEGATSDHGRTMGDSGANAEHWEYLSDSEIVYYSGGETLWLETHGDGAASSCFAGSSVNTGTNENGNINLWTTDGTTGSTTAAASPAGAVTGSFNYGVQMKILIQEAPYQTDGGYRIIGGAVEGRHDQAVLAQTNVDDIFVGWRIDPPAIDDLRWYPPRINLQTHNSAAGEQIRIELWTADGGAAAINGDLLVGLLGLTATDQGTGWTQVGSADSPVATVTPATTYRVSVKGTNAITELNVWVGNVGSGPNNHTDVGYPAYGPGGTPIGESEREVLANNPGGPNETQIVFTPGVVTTSPNPSDGQVESPNNLPMIEWVMGKPRPTVTGGPS